MKRLVVTVLVTLLAGLGTVILTATTAQAAPAWPVLRQGASGADVRAVQHLLTARGFGTTADGSFGPTTATHVVAFQRSRSLTADGVVGTNTWSALVATQRYGDHNTYVKAAQVLLDKYGYRLTVDGAFGVNTRAATLSFQKAKGITADGVIGPVTWQYLAGATGSPGTVVATSCSSVTGPVPSTHTTVVTGPTGRTFRVHQCLAASLDRLLDAAYAAGHTFGCTSCYRSYDLQVATRRDNCGTSYYAIYQMPAGQCSPPTAIPGTSMHERGLAIDFNSNGTSLNVSDFNWLVGHAAAYGLHNLPTERWHWSTNGH